MSSLDLDIPAGCHVWLDGPDDAEPDVIHIARDDSTVLVSLSVLASPLNEDWWELEAKRAIAERLQETCSMGKVEVRDGRYGEEIVHILPSEADDLVIFGVSRHAWTVKCTIAGDALTANDYDFAVSIVEDLVIFRGPEAMFPGEPLPLGVVEDGGTV